MDKTLYEQYVQVPLVARLLANRGFCEQDLLDRQAVAAEIVFSMCGAIRGAKISIVDDALTYSFLVCCPSMQKRVKAD